MAEGSISSARLRAICFASAIVLWIPACRSNRQPVASRDSAAAAKPTDSLVATSNAGVQIWFTLSRTGRAADGTKCIERGLEIRRGGTRIKVPLLYTGTAPVLLDESTMRAELWNHCRPVDTYLVDLRSGRPVRERPGAAP